MEKLGRESEGEKRLAGFLYRVSYRKICEENRKQEVMKEKGEEDQF